VCVCCKLKVDGHSFNLKSNRRAPNIPSRSQETYVICIHVPGNEQRYHWFYQEEKGGIALAHPTYADLFTQFQQRLSSAGGESHRVASLAEALAIIAAHPALLGREIVVPPNFGRHQHWGAILPLLSSKGITIREAGNPASVADAPSGLSGAELAIAETGSVLLAENSLEARVVSMLTLTHFVLVSEDRLVPMLDDAAGMLQRLAMAGADQRHYMSFVTGPSRTADIERTLTIGVQGPKMLCIIIVAGGEGAKP
jgi:L-lactate dehydrogenase complex protein LldG